MKAIEFDLQNDYAVYGPTSEIEGSILFGFDLDHTIIKPTKGTFYKGITDWEFVPGMDVRLKKLYEISRGKGSIVIFTNQGGVAAGKITVAEVIARISAVMGKLGFPFLALIALSEQYRKPGPLLFEKLIYDYMSGFKHGYYIGDASGLDDDFSDSDYRFALNTGLKYITVHQFREKYTPAVDELEETMCILDGACMAQPIARVPVRAYITPGAVFQYPDKNHPKCILGAILLLVGPPGCGKSSYAMNAQVHGWTVISRDNAAKGSHATAAQCLTAVKKICASKLKERERPFIIMDATHPDAKAREPFVKYAVVAGLCPCVVTFDVTIEVAKYINKVRAIVGGNYVPEIAYGVFSKRYEAPTAAEGFVQLVNIKQIPQDLNAIPDSMWDLYL